MFKQNGEALKHLRLQKHVSNNTTASPPSTDNSPQKTHKHESWHMWCIYIYPSPASHMYTYIYICKISLTLKIHYISPGPRVFWDTPTPGPYHCHLHLAQGTTQGSSPALALGRWFLESCEGARYSETWGWQDQQDVMPLGPGKVQVSLHTSHQKWVPKSLIWKSNEKKNYFISQKET